MISERRRIAERSRSEGHGKAAEETYRKTFAADTTLILSTDGEFLK